MANSKYEYVKLFEVEDEIMLPNIIVVRVDGRDFCSFHEFEKPYDMKALELMNECAKAVLEHFPDIIFSYGFSDEYSFVFKKATKFYQRRARLVIQLASLSLRAVAYEHYHIDFLNSKIHSLIVSFLTSVYVTKWKVLFPQKDLRCAPSFRSRVICASVEALQAYLVWRQSECHLNNQYDTCLWQLIKSGKPEKEAKEMLKGSQKQDRNELLYKCFNINYKKDIPKIFRQGTCILKKEDTDVYMVEAVVEDTGDVTPIKRPRESRKPRRNVIRVHSENIASRRFWIDQSCLLKEFGLFSEDFNKTKSEYVKSFQYENPLMLSTWIVVRVDGCHFHRFSDVHEFEKPNDAQALNLMNSCASGVLEEFKDIVFAYGVSDEYSFVLEKGSSLYQRHASEIVSAVVSLFSSMYTMKWKEFFPHKDMKYPPYFDGRAVCYPSRKILRDYLTWRQVDCHINNQYNTCFWMLIKSGKSKSEAQNDLKGTQVQRKNELLDELSGTPNYYSTLPPIFRQGSSVYWEKDVNGKEGATGGPQKRVVVKHCDIIKDNFWEAHPEILNKKCRKYHSVFMLVFILLAFTVINCWCSWFIRNI